jgi:hypothetical protein
MKFTYSGKIEGDVFGAFQKLHDGAGVRLELAGITLQDD